MSALRRRTWLAAVALALAAAGCTGGAPEVAPADLAAITERVAAAGVSLTDVDGTCATDALDGDEVAAIETGDELSFAVADALARAVTDCAGPQVIARSSLAVLSGGASEASIECAADAFDADLVVDLLRGRLTGEDDEAARPRLVELEVAVSLGECLTPAELAGLG